MVCAMFSSLSALAIRTGFVTLLRLGAAPSALTTLGDSPPFSPRDALSIIS
jgi:hypothetical protein